MTSQITHSGIQLYNPEKNMLHDGVVQVRKELRFSKKTTLLLVLTVNLWLLMVGQIKNLFCECKKDFLYFSGLFDQTRLIEDIFRDGYIKKIFSKKIISI